MPRVRTPYIGQWGISANRTRNDCGLACLLMLLELYGKRGMLTVDQMAVLSGLIKYDSGLQTGQIVNIASMCGFPTKAVRNISLDRIRAEIDAGRPCIVLVAYRFILGRLDQADNVPGSDGHYVVVVGYDDSHFVINDPDYWVPYLNRGHDFPLPVTQLDKAMSSLGSQAVLVEVNKMSAQDRIYALAKQSEDIAGQIAELARSAGNPPVSVEPPLNGTAQTGRTVNEVNLRTDAIVGDDTFIEVLPAGSLITWQGNKNDGKHEWASLTYIGDQTRTYTFGNRVLYAVFAREIAFPK